MRLGAITIFCLADVLATAQKTAPTTDFVISTDVSLVMLDVSVKDAKGGYVGGLVQDDFNIFEDRKLQPIKHFARMDVPVTVGLVVDTSGSMRLKRPAVITAALAFIQASNPHDEMFVVNFNDKVRPGLPPNIPFSDHIPTLRSALWMGNSEGRTALYDAVSYSLHHLEKGRKDKKTLVLVSDGGDNASSLARQQVLREVEESRATVYTIGIFEENDPDKNPELLKKLAAITGGDYYPIGDLSEVLAVSRKIASDIRNRYTLSYAPPDPMGGHASRSIKVTASQGGKEKLVVRTRTRYSFPEGAR